MMWQERQNSVVLACSKWCVKPPVTTIAGRMQKATNARILPPRLWLSAGRRSVQQIKPTVRKMRTVRVDRACAHGEFQLFPVA